MNWSNYVKQIAPYGLDTKVDASIEKLVAAICQRVRASTTIWCFGNGGCATTAEHFATDLLLLGSRVGVECKAISLTSQIASLTAIANDFEYSQTIEKQMKALMSPGDLVVGFSASGNSKNIINALKFCQSSDIESFCFLGFDGGEVLKSGVTQEILFTSEPKLYGLIENLHLIACHHIIDELVAMDWTQREPL